MALKLNLIVGEQELGDQFEYIEEETSRNAPSSLFIKGPYMMAEDVNRNNRRYPLDELTKEVDRYITEMVEPGRAMGELNHPTTADVDLERACHMVTEIKQDGNIFYGKSKILTTPCGLIVRSLINDGVKVGMSSRALGTLEEGSTSNTVRNLKLVAIDCVADPSFPKAFVNGILESKQWVVGEDGDFEAVYDNFEKAISKLPRKEADQFLTERIIEFLNHMKL
tara:strand:- start:1983 stop:2654 length:672 start_codon:yes stop_codon:yes gene_type:complete